MAALCVGWAANAQSRTEYSTGTSTIKWRTITDSTDLLGSGNYDSRASEVMDIGFVFPLGSHQYTQFSVNSDGNLRLGSEVTGTANYTNPFDSDNLSANSPKINFLGCDGYHLDSIHYVYAQNFDIGIYDGGKLLVVEFCLGTYRSATRTQKYKWQVHLYGNGNIEVVYPSTVPAQGPAVTHQQGFCFSTGSGYIVNSSHEGIIFEPIFGSDVYWPSGSWPEANRYYRFKRRFDNGDIYPNSSWQTHTDSTTVDPDRAKWYVVSLTAGYSYLFTTGCGGNATADFDT